MRMGNKTSSTSTISTTERGEKNAANVWLRYCRLLNGMAQRNDDGLPEEQNVEEKKNGTQKPIRQTIQQTNQEVFYVFLIQLASHFHIWMVHIALQHGLKLTHRLSFRFKGNGIAQRTHTRTTHISAFWVPLSLLLLAASLIFSAYLTMRKRQNKN